MVNTRLLAALLILGGVIAIALPTFGAGTVETDRPTLFSINSEDQSAIGIEGTNEVVDIPGQGNPTKTTIGYIRNNGDTTLNVEYSASTTSNSIALSSGWDTAQLNPGQSTEITARCIPPGQGGEEGSGTATIVVNIESAYAEGVETAGISDRITVEYDCEPEKPKGPPGQDDDDMESGDGEESEEESEEEQESEEEEEQESEEEEQESEEESEEEEEEESEEEKGNGNGNPGGGPNENPGGGPQN